MIEEANKAEPVWKIDEAIELIRKLQPLAREVDFHLCLAGSVLNTGESYKDLDIVALPIYNGNPCKLDPLIEKLSPILGEASELSEEYSQGDEILIQFYSPKRIDLFVYEYTPPKVAVEELEDDLFNSW